MTDKKQSPAQRKFTPDWFVSGVLAKIGETFDKLTGRNWKPSSSLATSELIEKLKKLLDMEVKDLGAKGKFVPHNIKLKMQWDKFSTDAEGAMKKLENELLAAAIDHINDNRYHTFAPLKVQIKPDYFTDGVKLLASFDEFAADEQEAEMNVTIPQIKVGNLVPPPPPAEPEPETGETYIAEFSVDEKSKTVELNFTTGKRISVGRTKENDLSIDDTSISKNHATLMLNAQGKFLVADTGSTNGTFINNERIAYGRAFAVSETDKVKFGNIEVFFRKVPKATTFVAEVEEEAAPAELETENLQAESRKTVKQENVLTEAFNTKDYDLGISKPAAIQPERTTVENPERKTVETEDWAEGLPVKNGNNENPQVEGDKEEESVQKTEQGIKLDFGESGKS